MRSRDVSRVENHLPIRERRRRVDKGLQSRIFGTCGVRVGHELDDLELALAGVSVVEKGLNRDESLRTASGRNVVGVGDGRDVRLRGIEHTHVDGAARSLAARIADRVVEGQLAARDSALWSAIHDGVALRADRYRALPRRGLLDIGESDGVAVGVDAVQLNGMVTECPASTRAVNTGGCGALFDPCGRTVTVRVPSSRRLGSLSRKAEYRRT